MDLSNTTNYKHRELETKVVENKPSICIGRSCRESTAGCVCIYNLSRKLTGVLTKLPADEEVPLCAYVCFVCLFLCATVTVFQLCIDSDMMHEIRRRKPKRTLLPMQGIF